MAPRRKRSRLWGDMFSRASSFAGKLTLSAILIAAILGWLWIGQSLHQEGHQWGIWLAGIGVLIKFSMLLDVWQR